jgi:hypothetical protein
MLFYVTLLLSDTENLQKIKTQNKNIIMEADMVDFYLRTWGFPDLVEIFRGM